MIRRLLGFLILLGVVGFIFKDYIIPKSDTLTIGMIQEPNILNPILELNSEAKQITNLVFDGLTNPADIENGRQQYIKALADELIEDTRDRKKWVIKLKKGIKWHNNIDFTADDVIFTWNAIHGSNSPYKVRLDRFIANIEKQDDYTINLLLREERIAERVYDLLSFKIIPQMIDPTLGPNGKLPENQQNRTTILNAFNYLPIGTGGYYINQEDGRPSSGDIFLKANELGVLGKPNVDKVNFKRYPGWDVVLKNINKGIINLTADIPSSYFEHIDSENVKYQEYSPYSFYGLVFNTESRPFNQISNRQAVCYAIERKELAESLFPSSQNINDYLNESIYPSSYEHVLENPDQYQSEHDYNIERAEALFNRTRLQSFRFLFSPELDGEYVRNLARTFQEMVETAGGSVTLVEAANSAEYMNNLRDGDFDAAIVLYRGIDHFCELYSILERNGSQNYSGYTNSALRNQLSTLKLTLAHDDVSRITKRIHNIIDQDLPVIPLFSPPKRAYYTSNISNLTINPEYYFNMLHFVDFNI